VDKICYGKFCVYLSVTGLVLALVNEFTRSQRRR
jgi:hypothetical protein